MQQPALFMTRDGAVSPRVHLVVANDNIPKLLVCGMDFIREAEVVAGTNHVYKAISESGLTERELMDYKLVKFPQGVEPCFSVEGVYQLYVYRECISCMTVLQ